jgi:t-SNARE complex subunit (syntaxin)
MDLESSVSREHRLKRIEDKYEYVNLICSDINQLMEHQTDCIKNLDGNIDVAVQNTGKGKDELARFNEYKQKTGNKTCALLVVLVLILMVIGYALHSQFGWAVDFSRFRIY